MGRRAAAAAAAAEWPWLTAWLLLVWVVQALLAAGCCTSQDQTASVGRGAANATPASTGRLAQARDEVGLRVLQADQCMQCHQVDWPMRHATAVVPSAASCAQGVRCCVQPSRRRAREGRCMDCMAERLTAPRFGARCQQVWRRARVPFARAVVTGYIGHGNAHTDGKLLQIDVHTSSPALAN